MANPEPMYRFLAAVAIIATLFISGCVFYALYELIK